MGLLKQGGDVIMQVLRNPAQFAGNLLKALTQGFGQFRTNAGKWLKEGLGTWLTGASGIQFPATLDLKGVFMTALSVMGLTYHALRGRLVKELGQGGEQKVALAEKAGGALASLTKGLHQAPEVKGQQGAIGKGVVDSLKGEVTRSLVTAGAAKVASMLVPGGAFVQALLTAFQGVQTLISQSGQIMGVIMNALGSVQAIAGGQVGAAAGFIERTIGGSIPIVLTFLGKLVGLGNFGTRIKNTVKRLRARLDAHIDKLVGRIKAILGKGKTGEQKPGAPAAKAQVLTAKIEPKQQAPHTLIFKSDGKSSSLMIHSRPRTFNDFITSIPIDDQHVEAAAIPQLNSLKARAIQLAGDIDSHNLNRQTTAGNPAVLGQLQTLADTIETIMEQFKQNHVSIVRFGGIQNGEGTWMNAKVLNQRYLEGSKPQDRDDSALYRSLNAARPKAWVRGHLLNEGLGGPGAAYNLVTLTQAANNRSGQSHYHLFEKHIKAAIMAGKTVRYNVRARHGTHPMRAVQQQLTARIATLGPGKDRQDAERMLKFLKFEQEEVALGLSVEWSELAFDNTTFSWSDAGNGGSGDVNNVLPDSLPSAANLPRTPTP
ncbi:DNA/RNA non-specific endonuclease [Deinococcus multiflagellatus]|uniref:DNA/RNA non-specific endonuclease n=2 Tax=Deinococcus multiflagellatus TaxID=1656887 RepID=A0ABW1ZQ41_9DEIO